MRTRTTRILLAALLLAALPAISLAAPVAARDPLPTVTAPPLGSPHPRVPGMFFFGEYGWGRLTFEQPPPRRATVLIATPWYSDAQSRRKVSWASELLGYPIVPYSSPQIPDHIDGQDQICNYIDPQTGAEVHYTDGPCEHVNFWRIGPQNGFSFCVFKDCQTAGHGAQAGWSTFLAHSETWARIETVTPPLSIGFEPCGPACDNPSTPTTVPTTVAPPTNRSPSTTGPSPVCDPTGDCEPRCSTAACPPPAPCASDPSTLCDVPAEIGNARVRIVLAVPDVFVTSGTLRPQDVRIAAVELRCGTRLCDTSDAYLDPASLKVTGTLTLDSMSTGYRECASSVPSGCQFRITGLDASDKVLVGDRVRSVFYIPTRVGETMRVRLRAPAAEIDAGEARVTLPVDVVTTSGRVVTADGLRRVVVGTTGGN